MPEKPKQISAETLAGQSKNNKAPTQRQFPVDTLDGVLREIRRTSGTGKLEIHFRNGHARGDAKWEGFNKGGT